ISWDPTEKVETFTVQPRFEGNASDFGMVIPTPAKPKLDEMPRDFFKSLALFTILKKREQPQSKLLPVPSRFSGRGGRLRDGDDKDEKSKENNARRQSTVKVLEKGIVGNLDYKIIEAGRADDLYEWLKENKYSYAGDESTLDFYIKKKW